MGKLIDINHLLKKVRPRDFVEDPLYFFSDGYWNRPMARLFCLQTNRVRRDVRNAYAEADILTAKGDFGSAHSWVEWAQATQSLCLPEGDDDDLGVVDESLTPERLSEYVNRFKFVAG